MKRFLLVLLCFSWAVPASAQAPDSTQPGLYSFWVNAGLFRGSLEGDDTVGLRLAANVGEATFVQFGAQLQDGGLESGSSQTAMLRIRQLRVNPRAVRWARGAGAGTASFPLA